MEEDDFYSAFTREHREIRDAIFRLIELFEEGDTEEAREVLQELDALTGPHFRYEEESLYPALTGVFGEEYIDELIEDHDGAIRGAARLGELVQKDSLTKEEREEGARLSRSMLPHVSDCDGLKVMVETLEDEKVRNMERTRQRAFEEELGLLEWARTERDRTLEV